VESGILPAVESGILPSELLSVVLHRMAIRTTIPPGWEARLYGRQDARRYGTGRDAKG